MMITVDRMAVLVAAGQAERLIGRDPYSPARYQGRWFFLPVDGDDFVAAGAAMTAQLEHAERRLLAASRR